MGAGRPSCVLHTFTFHSLPLDMHDGATVGRLVRLTNIIILICNQSPISRKWGQKSKIINFLKQISTPVLPHMFYVRTHLTEGVNGFMLSFLSPLPSSSISKHNPFHCWAFTQTLNPEEELRKLCVCMGRSPQFKLHESYDTNRLLSFSLSICVPARAYHREVI